MEVHQERSTNRIPKAQITGQMSRQIFLHRENLLRLPRGLIAKNFHRSAAWSLQAHRQVQQGCFVRAIRTNQAGNTSDGDFKGAIAQRPFATVAFTQALGFQCLNQAISSSLLFLVPGARW